MKSAKYSMIVLLMVPALVSLASGAGLGIVKLTLEQQAEFAVAGPVVYCDLGEQLIVRMDQAAAELFRAQSWPFEILDEHVAPGEYFMVFKVGPAQTAVPGKVLWQDDRRYLVKMPEASAFTAKASGYEMVRLPETPHTIVLPPKDEGPVSAAPDTIIERLISNVSTTNLRQTILDLQNYRTRYTYTWQCDSAAAYLSRRFSSLGVSTRYDTYILNGNTSYNVEATYPGLVHPESIVIACGHFDSYSSQAQTNAPGADDDASGVASALEIARVLTTARFRWTVKYVAFSGEEQWMKGSYHWVDSVAVPQGMRIAGVYNLDMIGYPAYDSNLIYITPNSASRSLAVLAESVNRQYGLSMRAFNYLDEDAAGDHTPFWEKGYKAVFVIEDSEWGIWNGSNPHYHTTHDTLGYVKMSLVTRTTKLALGCLATLAGPIHGTGIAAQPPINLENHRITISPNPMSRLTIISHPWSKDEEYQLMIYDVSGSLVREFDVQGPKTSWDGRDLRGKELPNGVYLMCLGNAARRSIEKLVILRR